MSILRHLEAPDFVRAASLPHFDGFAWHSGQHDPEIRHQALALMERKKVVFLYKQVLTMPLDEWLGQGDAWFDYVGGLPILTTPDGHEAVAWADGRKMIAWPHLTKTQVEGLVRVLGEQTAATTPPSGAAPGVLLDHSFRRPRDWMFIAPGPAYADFPAEWWPMWERRFDCFLRMLGSAKIPSLANSDRSISGPLYRELAQTTWSEDWPAWAQEHRKDILSVLADDVSAVSNLIDVASTHRTKWIAFTGHSPTMVDLAYSRAAEELGW